MLVSRLLVLMVLGSEFGCLGLENQGFVMKCNTKTNFHISWHSHDLRVHFSWLWGALSPIFMTSVALEKGLDFLLLFKMILGSPKILRPSRFGVRGYFQGISNNNSRTPETDYREPDTETGSLETEPTRGAGGLPTQWTGCACHTLRVFPHVGHLTSQPIAPPGDVRFIQKKWLRARIGRIIRKK